MSYVKRNGRHVHREVAERKLGRPLRRGEVVHHIDGDTQNNHPDNLQVLPSQSEHARLHFVGTKRKPKTHCKFGHALTTENTAITSSGRRRCLTCQRAYDNQWHTTKRHTRGLRKPGPKPGTVNRPRDYHGRFI